MRRWPSPGTSKPRDAAARRRCGSAKSSGRPARRREVRQVDRLRIVDEDDVGLQVQPLGVFPVDFVVQVEIALLSATGRPCKAL